MDVSTFFSTSMEHFVTVIHRRSRPSTTSPHGAFRANHAHWHPLVLGASEEVAKELAPIFTQKMRDTYQPVDYVSDDVLPTLRDLREVGFRLALVSNRYDPVSVVIPPLGLEEALELSLAGGEPGETAYVGDSYFVGVVCARAAGMIPVLVNPGGHFPEADRCVMDTISWLPEVPKIPV